MLQKDSAVQTFACVHTNQALCTEAALNAVQRRYPQIYKSSVRLALDPASISIEARDFMLALQSACPANEKWSLLQHVQWRRHLRHFRLIWCL